MGRHLSGSRYKRVTTISIDPKEWETFKTLVEGKQPDGDKSASAHVETLIKKENVRLSGSDVPDAVDKTVLERRLLNLSRRHTENVKALEKREDNPLSRFDQAGRAYGLKPDAANAAEVIPQMLKDWDEDGTPIKEAGLSEGDLSLFIRMIEIRAEATSIKKKLMDANRRRYLNHTQPAQAPTPPVT